MRVLVVGGSGLVGRNVVEYCRSEGLNCLGTYRSEPAETAERRLDKSDSAAVASIVGDYEPDAVIDTAAFHDVDACEDERERAWDVNAEGTANAARAADEADAQYVYLSTDYVFPGDPGVAPYGETDPVAPINYYAETKLTGEIATGIADRSTVLRPSVVYGLASDNFLTWLLGELTAGNDVGIVDDQISAPTYARDLARATVEVVREGLTGLYHATGPERLSRYEFTIRAAGAFGFDTDLVDPITTEELEQEAPRPADSTLDSSALYAELDGEFTSPRAAFETLRAEWRA